MNWFTGTNEALEKAIDNDSPEGVAAAIRLGADVNAKGKMDVTPLEYAIGHFRKQAYQSLLQLGADTAQRDGEKDNAMTLAVTAYARDPDYLLLALKFKGNPDTRRGDGEPIIIRFVNDRNIAGITMMKEHGANLDIRDRSDDPILITAMLLEYWDVAWQLLELGARYDYRTEPFTFAQLLGKPKVTPPGAPLWPYKVKCQQFLRAHGVAVPDLPGT